MLCKYIFFGSRSQIVELGDGRAYENGMIGTGINYNIIGMLDQYTFSNKFYIKR